MPESADNIIAQFATRFAGPGAVRIIRAPGRVNLIGEHVDYNDGLVLPMAIEPEVRIACRRREDGVVRIASTVFPDETVEFSVDGPIVEAAPAWGNYLRGVAAGLLRVGMPLGGMDALIENTLPVGGGLSSSAAIEVGFARAILSLGGMDLDAPRLAEVCQMAEHQFAHVPCGIMDQMVVAGARAGHAMLLDCRDNSRQFIPVDAAEVRVAIINTMVKHDLSHGAGESEYSRRKRSCDEAADFFRKQTPSVRKLRDVSLQQLEQAKGKLADIPFRRARHVITEIARTAEAARLLGQREYELVGRLMRKSHDSLRDDYEVSSAELDFLVDEAGQSHGVYGARMTGGGFGGCIVALVQPRAVDAFFARIEKAYFAKWGIKPAMLITTATAGAGPAA